MSYRKIGYYTSWSIYSRGYEPKSIPAEKLTHINYAFTEIKNGEIAFTDKWADIDKPYPEDGGGPIRGNVRQLTGKSCCVHRRNPDIRVLISIGGWSKSGQFSIVASTPVGRRKFIISVCQFVKIYGFDGVDIDWEYPVEGGMDENARSPDDGKNLVLLLQELRHQLDKMPPSQNGHRYELSIAAPAAPLMHRHWDLFSIAKVVDFINIMAYDFEGGWSQRTGHHSCLYQPAYNPNALSVDQVVKEFLSRGVPPSKLVMGVGLYGRGFANVSPAPIHQGTDCLGVPFSGLPKGTWEEGVFDYSHLATQMLQPDSGYTLYWDNLAKAPYLYNANERVMITFDDINSVGWKMHYICTQQLGGVMIWELNQDRADVLLDRMIQYLG
ncbi:hypothetical protein H4219_002103 [Mycoemilia scoparia]|uniref:GH18 domain-containing protein n=1 Tax=Mycoemilia scoparia TaxID=417184 RepID=A0A9W8A4Y6_9FUNG|nr:hypothetical protein H4219_002103 [Mycoemilia scoparia]